MPDNSNYFPLISEHSLFDAAILANGDYPTHAIPQTILHRTHPLVCCDGAGSETISRGLMPTAIIGDGDSCPNGVKSAYAHLFHQVEEQDDNDLTKATRYTLERLLSTAHKAKIAYLATTGKREDHTLGNIALMVRYYRQYHIIPTLITDYGNFTIAQDTSLFETHPRQQISIFNLSCSSLSGEGLRWPPYPFQEYWQGTLNEALGDQITIHANGLYMIFRNW